MNTGKVKGKYQMDDRVDDRKWPMTVNDEQLRAITGAGSFGKNIRVFTFALSVMLSVTISVTLSVTIFVALSVTLSVTLSVMLFVTFSLTVSVAFSRAPLSVCSPAFRLYS